MPSCCQRVFSAFMNGILCTWMFTRSTSSGFVMIATEMPAKLPVEVAKREGGVSQKLVGS